MQLLLNCFCKISGHDDQIMLVYAKSTSYITVILCLQFEDIMKWKFKQWWSTIPPISTKWTTTSHLKPLNTRTILTYGIWNQGKNMYYHAREKNVYIMLILCYLSLTFNRNPRFIDLCSNKQIPCENFFRVGMATFWLWKIKIWKFYLRSLLN